MIRLALLLGIIAAAAIGLLVITNVINGSDAREMASKTFMSLAVLLIASVAWRSVRGGGEMRDPTDKPVP